MKPDLQWPVPPRPGKSPDRQPKSNLPPSRAHAVQRLGELAAIAEGQVIARDFDGNPVLLPDERQYRTPAGFVHWCMDRWQSGLTDERSVIGTAADMLAWARDHEDRALVVGRESLHLLSALRGDIAIFHDGHCGIVTASQCRGCRHFGMAAFTRADEIPSVVRVDQAWLVNVRALVRVVLPPESPAAEAPQARSAAGAPRLSRKRGRTPGEF